MGITGAGTSVFVSLCSLVKGAQRLWASLGRAPLRADSEGSSGRVLNAYGHHWGGHAFAAIQLLGEEMCSTPMGITGAGTQPPRMYSAPTLSSAQRLWASLGRAQREKHQGTEHQRVLNAYGHHWGGHRFDAPNDGRVRCVLNAYGHHWGGHPIDANRTKEERTSAQRLWASLGRALPAGNSLKLPRFFR